MGFGLLKRPVYYQQVKTEPPCSCDKYCDVNELELMKRINDFTNTYYNLNKSKLELIKESKNKLKDIQKFYDENIINNKPAPVCCGDYCNKNELELFKLINNHYNIYFNLDLENKDKILEGAKNLKNIFNLLIDKLNLKPTSILSIGFIKNLIRTDRLNRGDFDNTLNVSMDFFVKALRMTINKNEKGNCD